MNGSRVRFAYNTNGFAHHRLRDAIAILARLGYDGIALTLDWQHLDPLTATGDQLGRLHDELGAAGLAVVVETGARFILDPWHKHEPTLVSARGRERRVDFLCRAIDVAHALRAEAVSFFSGRLAADLDPARARQWMIDGCRRLARHAEGAGVTLGLEAEPGMLIATLEDATAVVRDVESPALGLTLDIGHVRCTEVISEAAAIEQYAPSIRTMHIEDIRGREHNHLMFGEGDVDFEPILAAVQRVGFAGLVSVELSRDSHRAAEAAAMAIDFLRSKLPAPA